MTTEAAARGARPDPRVPWSPRSWRQIPVLKRTPQGWHLEVGSLGGGQGQMRS